MMGTLNDDINRWADLWGWPRPRTTVARVAMLARVLPLRAVALHRLAHWCHRKRVRGLPTALQHLNLMLYGLDIVPSVEIGPGLYVPHTGATVVMATRIRRDATLVSKVTIGNGKGSAFPTIGDNVYVGAGACILGPVVVGDGAQIGANAVVLCDVPTGATAVGVPARIIEPADDARL